MKRKTLFLLSILTISATLLSGCKSADSVDNSETIETTAIESEITEEIETVSETETEFILETETAKDGTPEATNSEGLTVDEAEAADGEYIDAVLAEFEFDGDNFSKLDAYAQSQGADDICGAWLVYYYGSAAGDQRSYAINQRTGEKMVAGPNAFFYGTSLNDDGAEPFWGTDKTYPGDKYPEFEQNMRLATGFDVD